MAGSLPQPSCFPKWLCNKISTMIYAASLIFRRKELSSRSRAKRSRPISAATTDFGSSSPRRVNTSARNGDMWSKRRRRSQPASMAAGDPSCACANLRVSSEVSSSIVTVPPVVGQFGACGFREKRTTPLSFALLPTRSDRGMFWLNRALHQIGLGALEERQSLPEQLHRGRRRSAAIPKLRPATGSPE